MLVDGNSVWRNLSLPAWVRFWTSVDQGVRCWSRVCLLSPSGEYSEPLTVWGPDLAPVLPCMVSCFFLSEALAVLWHILRLETSAVFETESGMGTFSLAFRWLLGREVVECSPDFNLENASCAFRIWGLSTLWRTHDKFYQCYFRIYQDLKIF